MTQPNRYQRHSTLTNERPPQQRIDERKLCTQAVAMTTEAPIEPVSEATPSSGPGWYVIRLGPECHIDGRLSALYRPASLTAETVYVGRTTDLRARMRRHSESLSQAGFATDRVLISTVPVAHAATAAFGELVLLNLEDTPLPLWQQLPGFGSRRFGSARERSQGRASAWDALHRPWVRDGVKPPNHTEHVLSFLRAVAILARPRN